MRFLKTTMVVASLLALPAQSQAATYEIDPAHSNAQFSVRHMMISNVKGEFAKLSGTVTYDQKDPTKSLVEATLDVASINTRDAKRDAHLKSPDFFDVAKYPTITFKSTKVQTAGPGKLKVTGKLTMHGVTRDVTLDVDGPTAEVKDPWGNTRVGASARTQLNRKDFGINWNAPVPTGGVVVGEEIPISLELEFLKKPQKLAGE
jgi:polyisoprenoid-binding protein YceI